ncbi:MAG: 1-(5-phosphoribosyl)-5-[(5-phosphoribosylamino)methylideneamino] imidazole-4-carboxamide isomerase [Polyangiaceae bacterium]|nr:1-(5-phosphoribosyl)-5-[(5-phosphoribosylamino)methylideneamino] imidazole-4-carboxamide isomerase [Polyangiaceae bacterium]
MQLWPAIDLLGGSAVRLERGRFDRVTVYDADPAAIAARWRGRTPRLHVVDLEGARAGRPAQADAVRAIARAFGPGLQVGGGVRDAETAALYFEAGAARVVLGSAALASPELLRSLCREHPGQIVLAVDAKGGFVATEGWERVSSRQALEVVRSFDDCALAAVLYTDVERDGTRSGPNVAETARLAREGGVPVLASGGVGSLEHLRELAACKGVVGAVVGRALYEGDFTLDEARLAAGDAEG